jgi:DinB family protein
VTVSASYDVDATQRETHRVVIELVESLDEQQFHWRPEGYATSIAFHAWHLARESDFLRAAMVERVEQLGPDFGPPTEIWVREDLLERWGFPPEIGTAVGTGLTDEVAASLPIPARDEVLGYLRHAYGDLETFVALLDERYPNGDSADPAFTERIGRMRLNILNFLTHDCRHLGMMEVLKGLQTGFGSATETR